MEPILPSQTKLQQMKITTKESISMVIKRVNGEKGMASHPSKALRACRGLGKRWDEG
jgi:hypothetical protein